MKKSLLLILSLAVLVGLTAVKPAVNQQLERIPDESARTEVRGHARVDIDTGIPAALYMQRTPVQGIDATDMAANYLREHYRRLGLSSPDNLTFLRTMETPGGWRVHLEQTHSGVPVWRGRTVISINRNHEVVFVSNGVRRALLSETKAVVSAETAEAAVRNYLGLPGEALHREVRQVVYAHSAPHRLAWQVRLTAGDTLIGDWEALVDAITGEIFRVEDLSLYIDGIGWVFDPCPITDAAAHYGDPGFEDNGDADSDSLTAHLQELPIRDIIELNGTYYLDGLFAAIIDIEAPYTGLHEQDSLEYYYTRSHTTFEAVNVYYHVDDTMRYLNYVLGFNVMPYQYEGGVHFDPHALDGAANAYYSMGGGHIAFGSPAAAVDAGEDTAIIRHEMGHAIHDWITYGGLSQNEGLSEGIADYWAQSHTRSFGCYPPGHPQYDWFGQWGLQPAIGGNCLRVTNFAGHYPEALNGQVHHDGQLWSSSMMSIYDLIGRTPSDRDMWEGISMTGFTADQQDAAFAVLQADLDLYNGDHYSIIADVFQQRGYIDSPVMAEFTADVTGGPGPLTVQFADLTFAYPGPVVSWEWDFDNDGTIDSNDQNPLWTYTDAGLYTVSLTASSSDYSDTVTKQNFISVNAGVFVFEGAEGGTDYSGAWIRDFLVDLGIDAVYSNNVPSSLIGFDSVFLSLGNIGQQGNSGIIPDEIMGNAIYEYTFSGGNIYIESSTMFGGMAMFGWPNYQEFWELFGLSDASFPFSANPINHLAGQDGSLAEGISFESSSQSNCWYIDTYTPMVEAWPLFHESDYGTVGVQYAGTQGQHTVCFSYALAELVDGDMPNTRAQVLYSILDFFDVAVFSGGFDVSTATGHAPHTVAFFDHTVANPPATGWEWDFDNDGTIDATSQNPVHLYTEPGHYTVTLTVTNGNQTQTVEREACVRVFDGESALAFGNPEQMAHINSDNSLNMQSMLTLEAWINPSGWGCDGGDGRILHKEAFSLYVHESGGVLPDHCLVFFMRPSGGGISFTYTPENSITLDEWQHIALTYNGMGDIHIYIDGHEQELQFVNQPETGLQSNATNPLIIGNDEDFNRGFDGVIDEVRLWNTPRSQTDIWETIDGCLSGNEAGLVGYWPMNEGNGDSLDDVSIYDHSATIFGANWVEGTDFEFTGTGEPGVPAASFALHGCYPNPFNP
ncbi:MAG: PKD domain-containing protein, partial [Candidatus Cloacimonetes bacterium]|nr:PKD domain-containing protein [Candidatus Cloacimonadota bacterium]